MEDDFLPNQWKLLLMHSLFNSIIEWSMIILEHISFFATPASKKSDKS